MVSSLPFIVIAIVVLVIVVALVFLVRREKAENRITLLASLAFAFILAGILFGGDRLFGYGLMGIGVILAVADILNRSRSR
ncbi:MAG: hypothetical protein JW900_10215 [Anaerolineae bacterium]|nr:hypothetical protein [Anaerolineae bacterium]